MTKGLPIWRPARLRGASGKSTCHLPTIRASARRPRQALRWSPRIRKGPHRIRESHGRCVAAEPRPGESLLIQADHIGGLVGPWNKWNINYVTKSGSDQIHGNLGCCLASLLGAILPW